MVKGRTLQRKEKAQAKTCGKRNYCRFKELKGLYNMSTDSKEVNGKKQGENHKEP